MNQKHGRREWLGVRENCGEWLGLGLRLGLGLGLGVRVRARVTVGGSGLGSGSESSGLRAVALPASDSRELRRAVQHPEDEAAEGDPGAGTTTAGAGLGGP